MTNRTPTRSYLPISAAILSFFCCGLGHIYLHRVVKGLILILSCCFAITIIWIGIYDKEFKVAEWDQKELMFSPSQRSISVRDHTLYLTDIMKVTGTIQLIFTWIFGIVDAWREGNRQARQRRVYG